MFHDEHGPGARHAIHNWEYADAATRAAATGFVTADLLKLAFQEDDESFWVLTDVTPTWVAVGGSDGFANPMVALGSLIVGGVSGVPTELTIGTALQGLRVNAGATGLEYAALGAGTVTASGGALTANAIVLGAGTTDEKVVVGITTDGATRIQLGVAGASVGGVELRNATSGTVSIVPPTGALGTAVLTTPIGTDTLTANAAAQTLTNKTLTSPKVGTAILDTNGNELLNVTATGSAVNELTLANAATGNAPILSATGGDTDIGITLTPKGAGVLTSSAILVTPATTTAAASLRAPHGTAPTSPTNGDIWTTTAGIFVRVNGVTVGPLAAGGGGSGTKTLCRWGFTDGQPPATNYGTFITRNSRSLGDFDDTTDESVVLWSIIPQGADLSSGIKRREFWKGKTATSGNLITTGAFERGNTDSDSDSFATGIDSAATAVSGTSGITTVIETNHSSSEIDGLTVGDDFYLKITRKASSGSDTVTGDAQLVGVEIQQIA